MLTPTEKARLIEKIKKCLRLSRSSNEHEAAAALRQARKLMDAAGVSADDVAASEASEAQVNAGAAKEVPAWEDSLAGAIADAIGVEVFFTTGQSRKDQEWSKFFGRPVLRATWTFVGIDGAELIASYAWTVLYRRLKQARADFIKANCRRCKPATKTSRADAYCRGWVYGMRSKIDRLAPRPEAQTAIAAYIAARYTITEKLSVPEPIKGKETDFFFQGLRAASTVDLHRPMSGAEPQKAITS